MQSWQIQVFIAAIPPNIRLIILIKSLESWGNSSSQPIIPCYHAWNQNIPPNGKTGTSWTQTSQPRPSSSRSLGDQGFAVIHGHTKLMQFDTQNWQISRSPKPELIVCWARPFWFDHRYVFCQFSSATMSFQQFSSSKMLELCVAKNPTW